MTWTVRKIGRIIDANGNQCHCSAGPGGHIAVYRAESVHIETGEVRTGWLCTKRASELAAANGIAFPAGPWIDATAKPPGKIFAIPEGTPLATCRSCRANVRWIITEAGNRMPVDLDGTSHFATCPNAAKHRKRSTSRSRAGFANPMIVPAALLVLLLITMTCLVIHRVLADRELRRRGFVKVEFSRRRCLHPAPRRAFAGRWSRG